MDNLKIHNFEQCSTEWHEIRLGKITGSKAYLLLVNGRDELGIGKEMKSFIYQKAGEIVTGQTGDTFKGNAATERGTALEPIAREAYENASDDFLIVDEIGFCQLGEYVGCSPDGLVGKEGIIEIKCPMATDFMRYIDTGEIDKKYLAQMQFNMFVTGRSWCDFIVFHPDFGEYGLQVRRIKADKMYFSKFREKIAIYEDEINRLLSKFN